MNIIKKTMFNIVAKGSGPTIRGLTIWIGSLGKAFYQRDGKEALPIIAEVMSQGGVEEGKMMQQIESVTDMKGVGKIYKMMEPMMGVEMEVVEISDKTFHFKMPRCPLGIEGTSKELCEAMMASDTKAISTLLGQEVGLEIIKTMAAGDKECDLIFFKK